MSKPFARLFTALFLAQTLTAATALTPAQADAAIQSALPAGVKVVGSESADAVNARKVAGGYSAPFVPGTQVLETTATQPTSFVRVYGDGQSRQTGGWIMRAEDIAGLTPQQIASKFALPEVPTMVTDVTIPAGTRLDVSAANGISPNAVKTGTRTGDNGGGGGVQFQIKTEFSSRDDFAKLFTNLTLGLCLRTEESEMEFRLENGLSFDQRIEMPDGSKIILADWGVQPEWSKQTQRAFRNHSVFRLDKGGNVIWQVKRDEGERTEWARARGNAEAENSDDFWTRSSFVTLILRFADGTRNVDPLTGSGPPTACWIEGSTVLCGTLDGQLYELDVDTGIAINKTPLGVRRW